MAEGGGGSELLAIIRKGKRQKEQLQKKNPKKGDIKGRSNDSPEIPYRRVPSQILGLPSELTGI